MSISELRWIGHGKRKILKVHPMEKGSHQPMGQVVTFHQTKKKKVCGTNIQKLYHTSIPNNRSTEEEKLAWIKMQDCKESSRSKFQILILLPSPKSSLQLASEKQCKPSW